MSELKLVLDVKAELGEGPIWDASKQVLYWVDILGEKLHIYDPATKQDRTIAIGQYVSTVVPRAKGGVAITTQNGFYLLDLDTEELQPIADPEKDIPNNRFNDGKCDAAGRFWAGTVSMDDSAGAGSLYCLDIDGSVKKAFGGVSVSNGIAWSLDSSRMYYIDSATKQVVAFDYDLRTGSLANRSVIVDATSGNAFPDGMTIDEEGMIWVALWDGYRVDRYDPVTGRLLQSVAIPTAKASACAFGGPHLDELYITTAREGMSPEQLEKEPLAGGVFCLKPGVKGIPAFAYNG